MFPAMSLRRLSKRIYKLAEVAGEGRGCGRAFSIAAGRDVPHCGLSTLTPEWAAKRTAHSWRSHGFPPSRSMLLQKLLVRVDARLTIAGRVRHGHSIRNGGGIGINGSGRWCSASIRRIRIHVLRCRRLRARICIRAHGLCCRRAGVRLCIRAHRLRVSGSGYGVRRDAIVTRGCRVGRSGDRRHWLRHRCSVGHSYRGARASSCSSALSDAYGAQQAQ